MSREFKVGDVVRAYDMGKPYDSVVVQTLDSGEQKMAFVHFRGWSRRFDSWYQCTDLAHKDDDETCEALHKRLGDPNVSAKFSATRSGKDANDVANEDEAGASSSSSSSKGGKKKRLREEGQQYKEKMNELKRNRAVLAGSDLTDEGEEDRLLLSKLALPYAVKRHLVDEWSLITAEPRRLVALPRTYTAERIFADYMAFKATKCSEEELSDFKDVIDGLIVWFDRALPMTLLYRQERVQYDQIKADMEQNGLTPSKVYGGEHVARMFVRMAALTRGIYVKQDDVDSFYKKISDFLKFFGKKENAANYFVLEGYVEAEAALALSPPLGQGQQVLGAEAAVAGGADSEQMQI